ncbi:MAG: ABC transporter substrate-binding protein [Candidatus Nanopelagicales bacterium]
MRLSKSILAASAAALVAVGLAACGGSGGDSSSSSGGAAASCPLGAPDESITSTVRIAYQNIPNGDLIVKDQKVLENCMPKATITWTNFASGGDVLQAYGAGAVDIGLTGSNPAVKALSAPLNTTLPPTVNTWIFDVIGKGESLVVKPEITSAADLKGKKIATPFSSTSHYSLLNWLEQNGLSDTDVELINLEPEKMVAAWPDLAGVFVWDPTLSELVKQGGVVLGSAADTAAAGKPTYDLANGVKAFTDANVPFMNMWAKAQNYAVNLILNDPTAAATSISAELGVPPADVEKMFAGYKYLTASEQASPDWLGGKLAKDFEDTAKFLLTQGAIDAVNTPEAYAAGVTNAFAAEAAK